MYTHSFINDLVKFTDIYGSHVSTKFYDTRYFSVMNVNVYFLTVYKEK
jgi:hypothetical protein